MEHPRYMISRSRAIQADCVTIAEFIRKTSVNTYCKYRGCSSSLGSGASQESVDLSSARRLCRMKGLLKTWKVINRRALAIFSKPAPDTIDTSSKIRGIVYLLLVDLIPWSRGWLCDGVFWYLESRKQFHPRYLWYSMLYPTDFMINQYLNAPVSP